MILRALNDEVFYTEERITRVSPDDIGTLKARARQNPRGRARLCAHPDVDDPIHEMLIVHARGCYVRPHKHLSRAESYHVIEGSGAIVTFGDDGAVGEVIPIGDRASGRNFFLRLQETCYHTLFIESEVLVFHETTTGPFDGDSTVFAPWSPQEDDAAGLAAFKLRIQQICLGATDGS